MFKILASIFILTIMGAFTFAKAQEGWKGIIPLVTTQKEVESKLGKPNKSGFYELKEGRVSIGYLNNTCKEKTGCHCLVSPDTVLYIRIRLNDEVPLKDLHLDPKLFKETQSPQNPALFSYANEKTGLVYEVQNGTVDTINYYESEKVCERIEQSALKRRKSK